MTTRAKTARRQVQVNGFTNRKVAPIMTNGSVHSDKINGDRKTTVSKNFREEKHAAGMRAMDNHNYAEAARQFSLIKPDTITSLYLCGCARLESKCYSQLQEAIKDFTKCMALASHTDQSNYDLEVWYKRAQTYYNLRKYNEAISDYTEFIRRCRSSGHKVDEELHRGLVGRGQTYQAMHELDLAMKDIDEVNNLTHNNDPYYLCCRASIYASKHENERALEDIKRASDVGCNQNHEALFQKGIVLAELGKHKAALEDYSKALKLSVKPPEQSDICVRYGMSSYALNDKPEALQWFERAITLHPYNAEAYYHRGIIQREKGLYKAALTSFNEAHKLAPERGDILLERALVNEQLGKPNEAERDRKHAGKFKSSSTAIVTTTSNERIKKLHEEKDRTGTSTNNHLDLAMNYDSLINQKKDHKSKMESYKAAVIEYRAAMENDAKYFHPQACALLALCHEKMNDLNAAYESQWEFYNLLDTHKEAMYHWKAFLTDIKQKMNTGKLEPHLDENTVRKLIRMELNRKKKDMDIDTFQDDSQDEHKNQLVFYQQMRIYLSDLLAAIGILNLNMDTIIHNIDQTTNRVSQIIQLIIEGEQSIGAIESTLNNHYKINENNIRKIDYDRIKMRLKPIGNVGDIIDQLDVAQLVARHLCTRYHSQLICLDPNNRFVPAKSQPVEVPSSSSSWNCCGDTKWVLPDQPVYYHGGDAIQRLSTFATAFIIQAINCETIRVSKSRKSPRKDALASTLVLLVCQAHLNTNKNMLSSVHQSDRSLPINLTAVYQMLKESSASNSSIHWDLYEFFRAPGIYYHSDGDTGKIRQYGSGPLMMPHIYGYRLGTKEEVDVFKKFEEIKNK